METVYAIVVGFFLTFPEPRIGVFINPELEAAVTEHEQACRAGCFLNFEEDGRVRLLSECEAECEGYDGEAG